VKEKISVSLALTTRRELFFLWYTKTIRLSTLRAIAEMNGPNRYKELPQAQ
jgi:hypothetical protein